MTTAKGVPEVAAPTPAHPAPMLSTVLTAVCRARVLQGAQALQSALGVGVLPQAEAVHLALLRGSSRPRHCLHRPLLVASRPAAVRLRAALATFWPL